ncbi:MAG: NusG domain II-containing protein [Lentisphaerae bacterium]|nr:NusG domain II-containing protein [Lentisphaerota bacterium]
MKLKDVFMGARVGDYVLAALFLILAIAGLWATAQRLPANAAKALVYHDRVLWREIDLSSDRVYSGIAGRPGMDLEVRRSRVRIVKADCPRQLCRHSGWLSRPGQSVVCLPNRLLIELTGPGEVPTCDAVSY